MMSRIISLAILMSLLISCSAPKALFSVPEKEYKAGEAVSFTNESENGASYLWDFGDGEQSEELAPSHTYWQSGRYTVTLQTEKDGKVSTKKSEVMILPPDDCLAIIETDMGNMIVKLYDDTPLHRDNFQKLAEQGFYDDLLFHRVIYGFMIQGGDPQSKNSAPNQRLGMGGPGYTIPAEISAGHPHIKGALAAARRGGPGNPEKESSGSQFYIVQGRDVDIKKLDQIAQARGLNYSEEQKNAYEKYGGTPQLDGEYTVYGQVVKGLEVIDKIAGVETGPADRPKKDVKMKIKMIK